MLRTALEFKVSSCSSSSWSGRSVTRNRVCGRRCSNCGPGGTALAVQVPVCIFDHIGDCVPLARERDAACDRYVIACAKSGFDYIGGVVDVESSRTEHGEDELVAAVPQQGVVAVQTIVDDLGDPSEYAITGRMSVGVVDGLEAVHIDKTNDHGGTRVAGDTEAAFELTDPRVPAVCRGQLIGGRSTAIMRCCDSILAGRGPIRAGPGTVTGRREPMRSAPPVALIVGSVVTIQAQGHRVTGISSTVGSIGYGVASRCRDVTIVTGIRHGPNTRGRMAAYPRHKQLLTIRDLTRSERLSRK